MDKDAGRGLCGQGCKEGTVWTGMRGGDCVDRDVGR